MKLILVTLLIGFAAAAQLSGKYLPPNSAQSSGGHGSFLQGPGVGTGGGGGGGAGVLSGGSFPGGHAGTGGGSGGGASGAYDGQYQHRGPSGPQIPILKYENVNNGDGSYHFEYLTGNGISQQEQGHLNNPGSEYPEQVVQGSYSYTGDDGHVYTVQYKADGNGFQATGDHLPTPPPIPEAIQKSLAFIASHPNSQADDSGAYSPKYSSGGGQQQSGTFNQGSGYHY